MPDLIVLVPGITGSVLRRPGGRVVWQSDLATVAGGLARPLTTLAALALPPGIGDEPPDGEPALVPDGLVSGWHVGPGLHTGSGYAGLLREANRASPAGVRVFDYDWRLSNRYTARLLGRRVERWLDEWRTSTDDADAKVCFVGHSMGGLVLRYYLEVLGGRELATRMITLGTPFSGAVKAVRVLTGDAFDRRPFSGRVTTAVRSFPSVGQLLPGYRCVATGAGPVTLAGVDVPDLPTAIAADGLAFHAEIAAAVDRNPPAPYESHVLIGTRHETLQSIRVDGGRVTYLTSQRGVDHRGDGTVATFAAVPPDWTDTRRAQVHCVRHVAFADSAVTMAAVRNTLSPVDLGDVLHPAAELGLGVPEIVAADHEFTVTVHSDRDDLLLHASLTDPTTGRPVTDTRAYAAGDGDYHVTLLAPPGLWRVEVTAPAEVPPVTVSDLLLSV